MLSPNAVGSIDAIEYLSGASTEVRSEGSGPPLILLHGLQSDLTIWDGVCEHLRSVERIRLNFPGRGKSARGSDTWHSLEYFYSIGRFAELLHSLVQKLDRRVSIAGWSMGAMVALEYVKRYGTDDIRSLVLCSGLSKVAGVANIFQSMNDEGLLMEISERSEKAGLKGSTDPLAVLNCWKSMLHFDCREVLYKIDIPTLIVHGIEDLDCPFSDAMLVSQRIPCSELVALDGCGHLILSERPEAVGLAISEGMKRLG